MDTRTAWLTNLAGHDYTKLEVYGTVRPITKGYVNFQSLDRVKYDVVSALSEYHPNDYLALSGVSVIGVIAAVEIFRRYDTVNILNYDKDTQEYRTLTLTADSLDLLTRALQS